MSTDTLDHSASPRRHPRRGDKVVASRLGPDCVSGKVVTFVNDRVTIETDGKTGTVTMEFNRFTWNQKSRAWVCWSRAVIRDMRAMDKMEDRLVRPARPAQPTIGDFVLLSGDAGWITKQKGKPTAMSVRGMMINKLDIFVVSTKGGLVEVPYDAFTYDTDRRVWVGRLPA